MKCRFGLEGTGWTEINENNPGSNKAGLIRYSPQLVMPCPDECQSRQEDLIIMVAPPETPANQLGFIKQIKAEANLWYFHHATPNPFSWANWPCLAPLTNTGEMPPSHSPSLVPNPVQEVLSVDFGNTTPDNLFIVNQIGQKMQAIATNTNAGKVEIQVAHLHPGAYRLVWESKGGRGSVGFIKQ